MLDFEVKFCQKEGCGKQYVIDEFTSKAFARLGLCDDCYFIRVYGTDVHAIRRRELVIRDWEDKKIAKQWKEYSIRVNKKLDKKYTINVINSAFVRNNNGIDDLLGKVIKIGEEIKELLS